MAEIKWIKITTNMFEDEKIDFIESLPEADTILIIWAKLLTLAGKCNLNGYIMLTEKIPYTMEMLSHKFRRPLNVVKFAFETFVRLEMVTESGDGYLISNWDKHQNVEGMDKVKEQTKNRVAAYREKKKLISSGSNNEITSNVTEETSDITSNVTEETFSVTSNVTCNATCNESNVTVTHLERDLEIDIERDLKRDLKTSLQTNDEPEEKSSGGVEYVPYRLILEIYNSSCARLPKIKNIEGQRKKHVKAAWKCNPNIDYFKSLFKIANECDFLCGQNSRAWVADFDWVINPTNRNKILEDKYKNKSPDNQDNKANHEKRDGKFDKTKVPNYADFQQREYAESDFERFYANFK